jgi:hypothetical protein
MKRPTCRAVLEQLALLHGIDPVRAVDDTLAVDFLALLRAARVRRGS